METTSKQFHHEDYTKFLANQRGIYFFFWWSYFLNPDQVSEHQDQLQPFLVFFVKYILRCPEIAINACPTILHHLFHLENMFLFLTVQTFLQDF